MSMTIASEPHTPNCLTDATSTVGLQRLTVDEPAGWRLRLAWEFANPPPVTATATVSELMRGGNAPGLVPGLESTYTAVRRARRAAALIVAHIGDERVGDVDQRTVERLLARLDIVALNRGKAADPDTRNRVVSLGKRAMTQWISQSGRRVPDVFRERRPMGVKRSPRPGPADDFLAKVLACKAPKRDRLIVALAASTSLLPSEIRMLDERNADLAGDRFHYQRKRAGKWELAVAYLPRPVELLLKELYPYVAGGRRRSVPLFPAADDPSGRLSSLRRSVRRVAEAMEIPKLTLQWCHMLWQRVARSRGLPSEFVRGTGTRVYPPTPRNTDDPSAHALLTIACGWRDPALPPFGALVKKNPPLPRKRRAHNGHGNAEVGPRSRAMVARVLSPTPMGPTATTETAVVVRKVVRAETPTRPTRVAAGGVVTAARRVGGSAKAPSDRSPAKQAQKAPSPKQTATTTQAASRTPTASNLSVVTKPTQVFGFVQAPRPNIAPSTPKSGPSDGFDIRMLAPRKGSK